MEEKQAVVKKRSMRIWKWTGLTVVILVLLYTAFGFVFLPMIIESMLPEKLAAALARPVRVGEVAFNPYALTLSIRGIEIDDPDGTPFVRLAEIGVDAELAPALGGTWTLSELRLQSPRIHILRREDGQFNFSDLMAGKETDAVDKDNSGPPPTFRVRAFHMTGGAVEFKDVAGAGPFATRIDPVDVDIENLTNLPEEATRYRLALKTSAAESVSLAGEVQLASMRAKGDLGIQGVVLKNYSPYFHHAVGFDVADGRVGLTAHYGYADAGPGKSARINLTASGAIDDLALTDRKTGVNVVGLKRLAVADAAVDLSRKSIDVKSIDTSGLAVRVQVDADGSSSLLRLGPENAGTETGKPAAESSPAWQIGLERFALIAFSLAAKGLPHDSQRAKTDPEGFSPLVTIPEFSIDGVGLDLSRRRVSVRSVASRDGIIHLLRTAGGDINLAGLAGPPGPVQKQPETAAAQPETGPAWQAGVETIRFDNYALSLGDMGAAEPVRLDLERIGIAVSEFSNRPESRFDVDLDMGVNRTGSLAVEGKIGLFPLAADLGVKTAGIDIRPAQAYLADKVKVLITSGRFENEGRISLARTPDGQTAFGYRGHAAITEFATVDRKQTRDFLKWNSLYLSNVDVGTVPLKIDIREVALADFFARLIVEKDGRVNLTDILAGETAAPPESGATATETPPSEPVGTEAAEPGGSPPVIRIEAVTLQGGQVRFSDRQIQPNFESEFMDLGGRVSGLSSENLARADVLLEGRLDNHAPLKITGKINPLIEDRFTDIKISFSDIEMSPFTPYSGKYLGYVLDKGKLSLDLSYKVSQRELEAENRIQFDQLTLGDKVESPDATGLPIKLALALLEDRDGKINLDLPLRGNMDDPEFSVGAIVIKMLVNLVKKIITAPFAALGSLFGSEEMGEVPFVPGSDTLDAAHTPNLDKLAEALYQRPALKLDIQGEVDPEEDRNSIRQQRFHHMLAAQKIQDRVRQNLPVTTEAETVVSEEEYDAYLAAAYEAADFPKPREADGRIKVLPPEEMEKLITTHIEITDSDLHNLAGQRAGRVKTYLLDSGKVAPDRIFLKAPGAPGGEGGGNERTSRVVFTLK
jgi:Domain of Unknown Function (DUF748)